MLSERDFLINKKLINFINRIIKGNWDEDRIYRFHYAFVLY